MKNEIIFIKTHSGARTNIMANFSLMNKEMFLEDVRDTKKGCWDSYRFGKIGGTVDNLKFMSLEDFEATFEPNTFTPEQVTNLFRKEISVKYGEHKDLLDIKPLKKSELVVGMTYKDFSGVNYLYLGKVVKSIKHLESWRNGSDKVEEGHGFLWTSGSGSRTIDNQTVVGCDVLKSIKRLKESANLPKIELKGEYEHTRHEYIRGQVKINVKILANTNN